MTFNVFITQPEMEEQGKSVFREDGWLPTTFILKAHHLFFCSALGVVGSLPLGLLASLTTMKTEWQGNIPGLASQNGNPNTVSC